MVLFFFFQAEDGIRDHCVTGVQTCALPISHNRSRGPLEGFLPRFIVGENQRAVRSVREQLTRSNPDVVVGIERGGALLTDILSAGDPALVPKVRRMPMRRAPNRADGRPPPNKFDVPAMTAQFDALVAAGARKIAIVDYYMGGRTAEDLSTMLRRRM